MLSLSPSRVTSHTMYYQNLKQGFFMVLALSLISSFSESLGSSLSNNLEVFRLISTPLSVGYEFGLAL